MHFIRAARTASPYENAPEPNFSKYISLSFSVKYIGTSYRADCAGLTQWKKKCQKCLHSKRSTGKKIILIHRSYTIVGMILLFSDCDHFCWENVYITSEEI